jgi:putative two-component system response regulator
MPKVSGLDALKRLKADPAYADIPVVFLTGKSDPDTEALGFELGAIDYISKPFSPRVLLSRINTHLNIEKLINERTSLLLDRTEHLQKVKRGIVSVLANMVENRDILTGKHVERTSKYVRILIEAMVERGVYAEELNKWNLDVVADSSFLHDVGKFTVPVHCSARCADWDMEEVAHSVRLHDIGKITVTDLILNKKGKLTEDEFEKMKTHTTEGEKIIDGIIAETGAEFFLQNAKLFAGHHHEKWNGTGYPRGLKGEDISLQGRIMAVADVYDALVSARPYKQALPHDSAVEIIKESRGSHFDPNIVDVFLEISGSFDDVASKGGAGL